MYLIASTRLNCVTLLRSGWRKCERVFRFFFVVFVEPFDVSFLLRDLLALEDWAAVLACWRKGEASFARKANGVAMRVGRERRHEGQYRDENAIAAGNV